MSDATRSPYVRLHRGRLHAPLEDGEPLLAASRATFFGSANVTRSPRVPGEPVFLARKAAYRRWAAEAGQHGFPTAGTDFVLGVTDRRWIVWRTTKWWNLPADVAGDIPHGQLQEVAVQRVLVSGVLTLRFRDGGQAMIEAPLVHRLRRLVEAYERADAS